MTSTADGGTAMIISSTGRTAPAFSICIPQFNRTSFLVEACRSLAAQSFAGFEVCISDDRSTDGREEELLAFLTSSGLEFTYAKQARNQRYDGNLRSAIAMARGKFVFLLGNDDRLARPDTLERIHEKVSQSGPVHVAITNYMELAGGRAFRRTTSGILGAGPDTAARACRTFAFVSGVIFDAQAAKHWATDKWDKSEMYQMYIGCRILASGGTLLGIDEICIEKDIQISNESVDSYASKRVAHRGISPMVLPMAQIVPLVADAITPYLDRQSLENTLARITAQLLVFTYAFWLIEFRRAQSWRYAVSVYRGLRPKRILAGLPIGGPKRLIISLSYAAIGLVGLTVPVSLFRRMEPWLYRLAKRAPLESVT
jgi:glycosyltransferase involved in cell wall biosynthesis